IPVGSYTLVVHYIGYKPFKQGIVLSAGDQKTVTVRLERDDIEMQTVVVTGAAIPEAQKLFEKPVSQMELTPRQLRQIPQVAETDLLRSLQTLPGILPVSDFSSALYVRGGTPDQNLYLMDGTDVYNPEHAFGLFSTFNTDAIKKVDLSKGGFGAQHGGRLSSILSVTNLDGNREEFEGTASISLLSAKSTLQMPLGSIGSISGSIRRTYFDKTIAKAIDDVPNYYFYDGNLKAFLDLSPKNKLTLSFYTSKDVLDFTFNDNVADQAGFTYDWGNLTTSLRWTTIFSPRLFANFWITGSRFDSDFDFGDTVEFTEKNYIADVAFKGNLEFHHSKEVTTNFGFEQKNLDLTFQQTFPGGKVDIDLEPRYYAAYLQSNWQPTQRWDIEAGVRYSYFDSDKNYHNLLPRLAVKYRVNDGLTIKTAGGLYEQYLHRIPRAFIAAIWSASNQFQKGSTATHAIVGITKDFSNDLQLELETYHKTYSDIYSFNDNLLVEIQPDRFDDGQPVYTTTNGVFNRGEGESTGLEIFLRKNHGAVTGWAGYSLAFTSYTIDGINQGDSFPPRHDRTHVVNLVANIDWKNLKRRWRGEPPIFHKSNWKFGCTFVFTSGQPITLPGSGYFVNSFPERDIPDFELFPSVINDLRLPPYGRLDISFTYERHFKGWSISPYLQIFNVGNRKNVWFVQYDNKDGVPDIDEQYMIPILPTIGVNFMF
ncbi:MAG TPA: TonB-dependent receptor, partial [bacterium]